MHGEICPIFERSDSENISLIGTWMLHPINLEVVPDSANFMELGHIAPMASSYFENEPYRQIPNEETDVGNGCKFIGGAFLMGHDHPAPNEECGKKGEAYKYVMKDNDGVTILVREKIADSAPPSIQPDGKKWWQFWK